MQIRPMTMDDYDALIRLLGSTVGVTLRDADSREATARYLNCNPGLSFVAEDDESGGAETVIGCVMSGHDGRRGYLQHLVVLPHFRRHGIGTALVQACLTALAREGIDKTHIFVFADNAPGNAFWQAEGWVLRDEINMYSYTTSGSENA